jgi:hypothetical protein
VTEAKNGAVADIRMDCVPTSPNYGNLLSPLFLPSPFPFFLCGETHFNAKRLINCHHFFPIHIRTRRWQVGQMEQLERLLIKIFFGHTNPLSILRFTDAQVQWKVL